MAFDVTYRNADHYVVASIIGAPTIDEFLAALQRIGADSVGWPQPMVLVDLRGVATTYTFTEQFRIGQAVAMNFAHLAKAAAVVQAERITRVGEKAARHSGAQVGVFATEEEAARWLLE
jgi:hypothetical protein